MHSQFTVESLEIIFGSALLALGAIMTFGTYAATLAYLITRERIRPAPAVALPSTIPVPVAREHCAEVPAAVAG